MNPDAIDKATDQIWELFQIQAKREREAGMRKALEAVGCLPQTVALVIEREREWIDGEQ